MIEHCFHAGGLTLNPIQFKPGLIDFVAIYVDIVNVLAKTFFTHPAHGATLAFIWSCVSDLLANVSGIFTPV